MYEIIFAGIFANVIHLTNDNFIIIHNYNYFYLFLISSHKSNRQLYNRYMHTYVCSHAKIGVYLIKIGSVSSGGEVPSTAAAFPRWMATAIRWCR